MFNSLPGQENIQDSEEEERALIPPLFQLNSSYYQKLSKQLFWYSGARLISAAGTYINFAMVAQLNPQAAISLALINPMQAITMACSMGAIGTISNRGGRALTQNKVEEIGGLFRQGVVITGVTIPISIGCLLFAPYFYEVIGLEPQYTQPVFNYFFTYSAGLPAVAWLACEQEIALLSKRNMSILGIAVFKTSTNVFFAYLMIFGKAGFPALGFAGLGLANSISAWLALGTFTTYLNLSPFFKPYFLFKRRHAATLNEMTLLKELMTLSKSAVLQAGSQTLYGFLVTLMAVWVGLITLEEQQIIYQYMSLLTVFQVGIAKISGNSVSEAVGKAAQNAAKTLGISFLIFSAGIDGFFTLLFTASAKYLARPFIAEGNLNTDTILQALPTLFFLGGTNQLFTDLRRVNSSILRSYKETKKPLLINLSCIYFIALPVAFLLGVYLDYGNIGFYLAGIIGSFLGVILLTLRQWQMHMLSQGELEEQLKGLTNKFTFFTPAKKLISNFTTCFTKQINIKDEALAHEASNQINILQKQDINRQLREAASANDQEEIMALLKQGADINSTSFNGNTSLHWAAQNGHESCYELLLSAGANNQLANKQGKLARELISEKFSIALESIKKL